MKHISAVDNVANLRALVRHELREIGIKVPKPKKSKRAANKINQVNMSIKRSIFTRIYLSHMYLSHHRL